MSTLVDGAGKVVDFVDQRITANTWLKTNLRKIFPDHWSFLLGEIALYTFIILVVSGTFLTLWFKPSMAHVVYDGSFTPLNGVQLSEAYESILNISFEVRGGLLMRQVHHWSALIFVAAMCAHMLRIFFTGAFRKPREMNWIVGVLLLLLGFATGFTGYSLPDDLLSGTGLRIVEGGALAIPVVGTYVSSFLFGGEYPGEDIISRLYPLHILLLPGLIIALITAHLLMLWYQKHTQFAGPGRTEKNVIGAPLFPVYTAKAGGFFFLVSGFIVLMSAVVQINPVWYWGPYDPSQVSAGSQPDWYIGFLEGTLRLMPNWETQLFGFTLSWNILIPAMVIPGLILTVMALYPFLEQRVTGDTREHHTLDRPRNAPVRTGLGVGFIISFLVMWLAGGNDIIATTLDVSVMSVTRVLQVSLFLGPVIGFMVTKRICLGLQRRDRETVLHGTETGVIMTSPEGEFTERHAPLSQGDAYWLTAHERSQVLQDPPKTDANGIPNPHYRSEKRRAGLSRFYFADVVNKPTVEEYAEAQSHGDGHSEVGPSSDVDERALEQGQQ